MDEDRIFGTSFYDTLLEHFGSEPPSFWVMSNASDNAGSEESDERHGLLALFSRSDEVQE